MNLSEGCLFVLTNGIDNKLLEFVYPTKLKGNMVPINTRSLLGRAFLSKRNYISNNLKKEKNFLALNYLMDMGLSPVQKVVTYPVEFGGRIIAVLEVVRRGDSLTEAPDFGEEDLQRISGVIDKIFSLRVAAEAG